MAVNGDLIILGLTVLCIQRIMLHEYNTANTTPLRSMHRGIPTKGYSFMSDKSIPSLILVLLTLLAPFVHAQPTIPAQQGLEAFAQVEHWVRQWDSSTQSKTHPDTQPASYKIVIVTLRLDGRVIARGQEVTLNPSDQLLHAATRAAIAKAKAKLVDSHDALFEQQLDDLTTHITITIEIANELIPISKSELDLPGFGYTPGVLGVAVSRGDTIAAAGPESILVLNTDMTQRAIALANSLGDQAVGSLLTAPELAERGFQFYRFEPMVLAQTSSTAGASFLDRGGRVIVDVQARPEHLKVLASQIAKHISSRQWPGIESFGMMGTLDPITRRCESTFASSFDQSLTALAMLRYATVADGTNAQAARALGKDILVQLAKVEPVEVNPWEDPINASMTIIALSELELIDIIGNESLATMRTKCLQTLDQSYSSTTGFDDSLPKSSQGLIAYALVRSAKIDHQDRVQSAIAAIDQVFENTPVQGLVSQMPFLGWAAIEQGADMQADGWMGQLIAMRTIVWEHQLNRDDLSWSDRDLRGGIVFTSSQTPLPSWLGTKPIAIIATMLADANLTAGTLTQGQLPAEIGNLIDSLRFIHQLSATKEVAHLYASPETAVGGIRRALWDQHMPIEADAMALLAITESMRSFDNIQARSYKD